LRGLAVSFSREGSAPARAVQDCSLTVYQGQCVAVVGESGCGKSVSAMSLLRLLPSSARIDSGSARFLRSDATNIDLLAVPAHDLRRIRGNEIAMIFQEPMTSLNPVFSVGSQVAEAVILHHGASRRAARVAALDAMRSVGIPDPQTRYDQYPHQFSGGMRQRIMIATAIACRPRLLIADEPTTALDVTIQAQVLDLLASIRRERSLGMILITHDLGVVAQHADVVCVMYAGRVVEYARTLDLFERPLHPYTRGLLHAAPRLGSPRERLVTIREVIDDESAFRLHGHTPDVRPWWPHHAGPANVQRSDSPASDSVLARVAPQRLIALWRTPDALSLPAPCPDLAPLSRSLDCPAPRA
jgi:ABC-type dipeptide/oligopeptide/nickel transport system ATPase component